MSVSITAVAKALPPNSRKTEEILPLVELWLSGQEGRYRRKVLKIFEGAGVSRRYSIMDPEDVFTKTSFQEKNDLFATAAIRTQTKRHSASGYIQKLRSRTACAPGFNSSLRWQQDISGRLFHRTGTQTTNARSP